MTSQELAVAHSAHPFHENLQQLKPVIGVNGVLARVGFQPLGPQVLKQLVMVPGIVIIHQHAVFIVRTI
ncbi:hypothetical protein D1872_303270 [compost metagenome]